MSEPFTFVPGWLGIDENQRACAAEFPRLSQVAPHPGVDEIDRSKPILLYNAWIQIYGGKYPPWKPQAIGDCVSHGHSHGNDLLQCVELVMGTEPTIRSWQDVYETDSEFIYGASREVGNMLGRQDGSYGAAAVKAMKTIGMVSRAMLGPDGTYSGDRAKQWGFRGVPQQIKDMASPYKLGDAALVETYDDLVAALWGGHPVTECSNWLPSGQRDQNGFVGSSGRGGHCQLICGVRFDAEGAFILNNWPLDFYSGPVGLGAPLGGGWVDRATVERILSEGDSWALSGTRAFARPKAGLPSVLRDPA